MGTGPTKKYHKNMHNDYVKGSLTYLKPEYIKENANTDFPLVLNIEPTNSCNLCCEFCVNSKIRNCGYMDFELFKRIIDECKNHKKLNMINFHKDGEPLLHPDIYKMIKYAKDSNVAEMLHMNTNGLCLTSDKYKEFFDSGIDDVTFSLDASRWTTFKQLKGINALERIEKSILGALTFRKKNKLNHPFIRVKIIEFEKVSKEEIEEFIFKWEDVADDVQVTGIHTWNDSIETHLIPSLKADNSIEYIEKSFKPTNPVKQKRYACSVLWYALAVNWDGSVSPCSVDWDHSCQVGDFNKESLHDIWNGHKIKSMRYNDLSNGERKGNCKGCIEWCMCEDIDGWLKRQYGFYTSYSYPCTPCEVMRIR